MIGSFAASGCPPPLSSSDPADSVAAADAVAAALEKSPAPDIGAKSVLPADFGPQNTLFGVLMADDTQAFVLSTSDANGDPSIYGVAWYDADGQLLCQENVADGIVTLYGTTLDGLMLDVRQAKPRITMFLNASSPPSQIVMTVEDDGSVVLDEDETVIELTPNLAYDDLSAPYLLDSLPSLASKSHGPQTAKWNCADIMPVVVTAAQVFCDIRAQIMNGVPVKVLEASCITATTAIDLVRGYYGQSDDATVQRVLAGLKAGILATCQIGQRIVNTGGNANPLGIACTILSYAEAGVTMYTGQSLATQICAISTTDQSIGSHMTTDNLMYIDVRDVEAEDGDEIALRLNGQELWQGTVMNIVRRVPAYLSPGFNHFEFEALNGGENPPNTARVILRDQDGTAVHQTSYDLDAGQVATLDIVRQ
ncbi:MAG: hypothetical protein JXQ75_12315 [Phycisphaerae bacterium]|nr:hypothetical protein [Phycisphaerae bacterium]